MSGAASRGPSRAAVLAAAALGASLAAGGDREAPPRPSAPSAAAPSGEAAARVTREGLSIAFTLAPVIGNLEPGAEAKATFTITDAATGAPAQGLRPLGWMSLRGASGAPDDEACKAKVKGLLAGRLSARAEVDMTAYHLWAPSREGTISILDPTVAFSRTKLAAVVSLPGPPGGFAMSQDRRSLIVSVPSTNEAAIVDVETHAVVARVPVGRGPARVVAAPSGHRAFIGNDGDATVSVVDVAARRVEQTLDVGRGHHEIAFADHGRAAFVTSSAADRALVVDAVTLARLGDIPVPRGATAIAASDAAQTVLIARAEAGEITIIDAQRREVLDRVASKAGIRSLAADPSGRFVFALHGDPLDPEGELSILDATTGRRLRSIQGGGAPDAVAFTARFAYVRRPRDAKMSVIELDTIDGSASLAVVDVPIGAPSQGAPEAPLGDVIAPLPEGNGVVVANPVDKNLYHYVEGMMAPLGAHKSGVAAGVLIVDRGIREVRPGVYQAPVRVPDAGTYDVSILLDNPRFAACLTEIVQSRRSSTKAAAEARIGVEPLFDEGAPRALGEPTTIRFRMLDEAWEAPIEPEEVEVLILRFPGNHRYLKRASDGGGGVMEVTFTPAAPGEYRVLPAVASRRAPLGKIPHLTVHVAPKEVTP